MPAIFLSGGHLRARSRAGHARLIAMLESHGIDWRGLLPSAAGGGNKYAECIQWAKSLPISASAFGRSLQVRQAASLTVL